MSPILLTCSAAQRAAAAQAGAAAKELVAKLGAQAGEAGEAARDAALALK